MTRFHRIRSLAFGSTIALVSCAALLGAQQGRGDTEFVWSKQLSSGSTLAIRNGGGRIQVRESGSDRVEVRATKVRQTRTARDVAFDVDDSSGRTMICTLYDEQRSCRDRNRTSGRTTSVRVEYTVLVPRGIQLDLSTGSGEITVEGAGAGVSASTGTGPVFIATVRGPVTVSTGSGEVDVRIQAANASSDVNVTTGSGSIRVALPADFGGEIDAQSGNGTLRSDFDITIVGRIAAQHIRGTIGRGSASIHLLTGNGRIELRKY